MVSSCCRRTEPLGSEKLSWRRAGGSSSGDSLSASGCSRSSATYWGRGRPVQRVAWAGQGGSLPHHPSPAPQHLLQPAQMLLQPSLLQVAADLCRDVEPHLSVVSHVAYKGEGLIGLQRVRAEHGAHGRTPASKGGFSLLTSLHGWRPPTGQSPPTTNLGLARWPLEAPSPPLPGLCSAPPLKPPLPGSQESTASPPPATSGVFLAPLWDLSMYLLSGPDTWLLSSPMLILEMPSTAPPLPGPFPALVSTSSRLQPGRATDTVPSAGPKPRSCPALDKALDGFCLWPSSLLTSAAQPWPCSAILQSAPAPRTCSQVPLPREPSPGVLKS